MKIYIYANVHIVGEDFGPIIDSHEADTNAECEAWAEEHYCSNDYTTSYVEVASSIHKCTNFYQA